MSEPRIYSRNWIDSESVFTRTYGGTTSYLFDRNTTPLYQTSGANNDSTTESLYIYFYQGGILQVRPIDTVVLRNYNWKEWSVNYWNGSSWSAIASQTTDVLSDRYVGTPYINTSSLRIDITKTKTPNQEKTIGEIIVCTTLLPCDDMSSYDPKWRERSKEIVLGDGSIHKVYTKDKSGRLSKYEAALKFHYLSKATRDALKAIKDTGEPFLFQPESVTVPEDIYYVHWSNTWDEKYMSNFKSAGYEVVMNLKEV